MSRKAKISIKICNYINLIESSFSPMCKIHLIKSLAESIQSYQREQRIVNQAVQILSERILNISNSSYNVSSTNDFIFILLAAINDDSIGNIIYEIL